MEELQDPVLESLKTDPELVDSISQEIGFGTAQFVPCLAESLQSKEALVRSWHPARVYSQFCEISNGGQTSGATTSKYAMALSGGVN